MAAKDPKNFKTGTYAVSLDYMEESLPSSDHVQNFSKISTHNTGYIPSSDEFEFMSSSGLGSPTGTNEYSLRHYIYVYIALPSIRYDTSSS